MNVIIGILGIQGSGKTMLMTSYGKREYDRGKTIYSNYHLKKIDYIPIETLSDLHKMHDGIFLADELWLWLYSRLSMSKINNEIMKIVMLNRKRNLDIYYTAQLRRSVDVMLREVTTYFFYPFIIEEKYLAWYVTFPNGVIIKKMMYRQPLEYWGQFYDTTEEIKSIEKKYDVKEILEKGIILEEKFVKALKKIKKFRYIEHLPLSGKYSTWKYDVIGYTKGKTYAFDVKSSNQNFVNIHINPKELNIKIQNAYDHNAIPMLVFPRNDRIRITKSNMWYVHKLSFDSYLTTLTSYPRYSKLIKHSTFLSDYPF